MNLKFLHSKDLEKVLAQGTVVLSSAEYFRKLEDTEGAWIGDALEGLCKIETANPLTVTGGSDELRQFNQACSQLGVKSVFDVDETSKISCSSGVMIIHELPNFFIYSYSVGEVDALRESMTAFGAEPYDACLRIRDRGRLFDEILHHGTILLGSDTRPFKECFSQVAYGPVEYGPAIYSLDSKNIRPPSPFLKDTKFEQQLEHRMVAVPISSDLAERIIVQIPNPIEHFELVDLRPTHRMCLAEAS